MSLCPFATFLGRLPGAAAATHSLSPAPAVTSCSLAPPRILEISVSWPWDLTLQSSGHRVVLVLPDPRLLGSACMCPPGSICLPFPESLGPPCPQGGHPESFWFCTLRFSPLDSLPIGILSELALDSHPSAHPLPRLCLRQPWDQKAQLLPPLGEPLRHIGERPQRQPGGEGDQTAPPAGRDRLSRDLRRDATKDSSFAPWHSFSLDVATRSYHLSSPFSSPFASVGLGSGHPGLLASQTGGPRSYLAPSFKDPEWVLGF